MASFNHFIGDLKARLAEPEMEKKELYPELICLFDHYQKLESRLEKISRISDGIQAELRDLKDKYERQSVTDHLTGLFNRRYATQRLKEEIARFERYGEGVSVCIADIDKFKTINDTYGHNCGDLALRGITRLLINNLRSSDVVARWGGEEFLFLMPHTNLGPAIHTAEKIKKIVAEASFSHEGEEFRITMSFGLAQYQKKDTLDSVLTRADHALYMAKGKGRNQVAHL